MNNTKINLDKLPSLFSDYQEETEKALSKIREKLITQINPIIKSLFKKHPRVDKISWDQYTPYFNDGSVCEFGYYGLNLHISEDMYANDDVKTDKDKAYYYIRDGYIPQDSIKYCIEHEFFKPELLQEARAIEEDFNNLNEIFQIHEKALKDIFGDHVTVAITSNMIKILPCDHE